jgi:hypothetical protein
VPRRGFTSWYLGRRDWHPFADLCAEVRRSGLPYEAKARRAPILALLQSYGITLDLLLLIDIIGISLMLVTF